MYVVSGIAIVLILLITGVIIAANRQPRAYHVERSITTSAPADVAFAIFSDLGRWRDWSPYDKRDPSMNSDLSDPSHGVGANYAWNGNKDVGAGQLTITRVDPGKSINMDLEFTRPFKCNNKVEWRVDDDGEIRRLTWAMDGRNDPLMSRIFCLMMDMDKMCGKDFEAGLATLKELAEKEG